jgi:adenylate kinase
MLRPGGRGHNLNFRRSPTRALMSGGAPNALLIIAAHAARSITSEDLRRGPVLDNQSILIESFAKVRTSEERAIIFDGHCLVDAGEQPIEIPMDVVRQLQPSGIVLVRAPPDEIVSRRQSDA